MPKSAYGRILNDNIHVSKFLKNALLLDTDPDFNTDEKIDLIIQRIASAEMHISSTTGCDTLRHAEHRRSSCSEDSDRRRLRRQIFQELTQNKHLDRDDDIELGVGGALPSGTLSKDKKVFLVIGLPASGKSEVANILSDKYGAIILDSDYAKRKLPEYNSDYGTYIVHDESCLIVFGGNADFSGEESVLEYAIKNNLNIVIPRIGDKKEKICELAKWLKSNGYKNHLILVRLDREKATIRASKRFNNSGRYVSLPMIFDVYGNDPTIVFYDLQMEHCEYFSDYSMISSDVSIGEPKKILCSTSEEIVNIYERSV